MVHGQRPTGQNLYWAKCHQAWSGLQELEICLVCVHMGGGDTNTQAKEGALQEENLSGKIIT